MIRALSAQMLVCHRRFQSKNAAFCISNSGLLLWADFWPLGSLVRQLELDCVREECKRERMAKVRRTSNC